MTALANTTAAFGLELDYIEDLMRMRESSAAAQYALIFVERGTVQMVIDGYPVCLAAGDATLVTPNRPYRAVSGIASALCIARFDACETDIALPLTGARVHRLGAAQSEAVGAVLQLLAQNLADESAYRRLVRRFHLTALVATLLESRDVRDVAQGPSNALVRDALNVIDRRYAEAIGPAEIAREVGRHPAYLTNVVRAATGKSLGTWLIERRLGAARVLLSTTDDSIGDIAAAVGYVDVSHFARYFARRYGTPPARWRRRRSA